jgi:hypothetical protein
MNSLDNLANFVLMLFTLLTWIKIIVTNSIQGGMATKAAKRAEEDYDALKLEKSLNVSKEAEELDFRWRRIVMNDLENIPVSLVVFWGAKFVSKKDDTRIIIIVTIILFFLSRCLYSVCFALKI